MTKYSNLYRRITRLLPVLMLLLCPFLGVSAYDPMEGIWFQDGFLRDSINKYLRSRLYEPHKTKPDKKDIELVKKQILDNGLSFEEFKLTTSDSSSIKVLIIPGNDPLSKKTKIFLHGSTGGIGSMMPEVQDAYERGFSSVLLSYRGYSNNPGEASQKGITDDVVAAHMFIKKHLELSDSELFVHAHSLGAAIALGLMAELSKSGQTLNEILLHAPFYSFHEMASFRLTWAPRFLVDRLIPDIWNNQKAVKEISENLRIANQPLPKLRFFYSDADKVVPDRQSMRLEDQAKEYGFDTSHILINGYAHSDSLYNLVYSEA